MMPYTAKHYTLTHYPDATVIETKAGKFQVVRYQRNWKPVILGESSTRYGAWCEAKLRIIRDEIEKVRV